MLYALMGSENALCITFTCTADNRRSKGSGWVHD